MATHQQRIWDAYVAQNPQFEGDGNVTLSKRGLRKLFDQTYEKAYLQGEINGAAQQIARDKQSNKPPEFGDLFKGIFDSKKK